jgi:hypothetical protein
VHAFVIKVGGVADSAETAEGAGHGNPRDGKSASFALQVGVQPSDGAEADERADVCQYCGLPALPPLPPLPPFFLTFVLFPVTEAIWQTT